MKPSYAALAAALCIPTSALADDALDASDAIIVVGQRDAPIEIEPRGLAVSLGEKQFAAINAFNTEDLMKYAPDFFVRKRYAGDSNGVPGFRGTHSTQSARTLVMVDGFAVSNFLGNSFSFSPKWGIVGPGEVQQFDIVYGPYSSRYVGNSMGGIVNITTRDPQGTEAFAKVQGMVQPYRQFGTKDSYWGGSAEGGFGLKQKDGPWSLRVTARTFKNEGHPMSFYGLAQGGAAGTPVTGTIIVDPKQHIANTPGLAALPIFAAQSPALITQRQAKLKIGYDDGAITGQLLFAYWNNRDYQHAPDCYLRDASGASVCGDGQVTLNGVNYKAAGANWSLTKRDEFLLGAKLAAPLWGQWMARLALSTYQIVRSDGFTSTGYAAGQSGGAGKLSRSGPTGWWTGDLVVERKGGVHEVAMGATASLYRTDTRNYALSSWRSSASVTALTSEPYGKTRLLSGWIEDVWHLSDDAQITAGLRYDDWRAYDGGLLTPTLSKLYPARHDSALSPTLSGQIDLDGTLVQLSLAMATRFPTVGELFQGSLFGNGTFNPASFDPNLKPEKSKDANLLVSRGFGPIKLTGSLFYQRVKNSIFSFSHSVVIGGSPTTTSSFTNIDLTRQWGIEAIAEIKDWPLPGMDIEANAAWIDSKTLRNSADSRANGVQFPRIPKWRINANARYAFTPALQGSVGMRYASRPNTDLLGLQRGDTYGYTSELFALDAKLNWDVNAHLRLSAGVDNITNTKAWVYHPYPQRTFLIEAGWRL